MWFVVKEQPLTGNIVNCIECIVNIPHAGNFLFGYGWMLRLNEKVNYICGNLGDFILFIFSWDVNIFSFRWMGKMSQLAWINPIYNLYLYFFTIKWWSACLSLSFSSCFTGPEKKEAIWKATSSDRWNSLHYWVPARSIRECQYKHRSA